MTTTPLVSKTYRVQLTEAEHRAFAVWLVNNGSKASKHLAAYIKRTIKSSIVPVAEMHESENT
jgi:hypothetical protein